MLVGNKRRRKKMKKICKCLKSSKLMCYVEFESGTDTFLCLQKARNYFNDKNINMTQVFDERFDVFDENIPILN